MSFEFHIVSGRTVHEQVHGDLQGCVRVVEAAYRAHGAGHSINPNSYFLRFPERPRDRIIALPAFLGEGFDVSGIKWISSYPGNVERGFPRASAVLILNDADTGYPFACLESSIISAARTAASAVLAAARLSPGKRARTLGLVGNGLIARYLYDFFLGTGWEIENVRLFDHHPEEARRFAGSVCKAGAHRSVEVSARLDTLLEESDVVVFATTAAEPYVRAGAWLSHKPLLLNVSLRDLAPEVLLASNNVVDDVGHVLNANTSPHLVEQQVGHRGFINGTLAEVLEGRCTLDPERPTVFSPFGLGVLDLAVGRWVYDRAVAQGKATSIPDFFFELTR